MAEVFQVAVSDVQVADARADSAAVPQAHTAEATGPVPETAF